LLPRLQSLYELYRVLAKARIERGAMDFDTVETRIVCDPAGRIERIEPYPRNDAHKLIEECMLAANVCAADFMLRGEHAGLFRVHEGPTPEKLAALRDVLRQLAMNLDGGDSPTPKDYARLAQAIRNRPDAALLQTLLLRSMQQAIYTPHNSGHFGLAYQAYAHFTSPIRRYPDLLTHRVIKAILAGKAMIPAPLPQSDVDETSKAGKLNEAAAMQRWERYGELCSFNERRADDASRDVQAWLKCQYMRERVGEEFVGRITGVAPFGVFVTLDSLFVEGMVHVSELGAEYFQFNPAGHELRGERTGRRFRLTDSLEVQIAKVDLEARRIEFRLVTGNLQSHGERSAGRTQSDPEARANAQAPQRAEWQESDRPPQKQRKAKKAATEPARNAKRTKHGKRRTRR
jgi:ribonuclease R